MVVVTFRMFTQPAVFILGSKWEGRVGVTFIHQFDELFRASK